MSRRELVTKRRNAVTRSTAPDAGRVQQSITKAIAFSTLDSKFRIQDRVVRVDPVVLSGRYLTIEMRGQVDFEKNTSLEAKLRLEGSAGTQLAKVVPERTIPLRVTGKLGDPEVVPAIDLARFAGGSLLEDVRKDPGKALDRLKDLFK